MSTQVAIIGAGIAGLTLSRTLQKLKISSEIFEKSQVTGGRIGTQVLGESLQFDIGAQHFQVRTPGFQKEIDALITANIVAQWKPRFGLISQGKITPYMPPEKSYVGVPTMNAVTHYWAESLILHLGTEVSAIHSAQGQWTIKTSQSKDYGPFKHIVFACPPSEALKLLPEDSKLVPQLDKVKMTSVWMVYLGLNSTQEIPFDVAYISHHPIVWVARDSSKPKRPEGTQAWVIQANNQWSEENASMEADLVADRLFQRFRQLPFLKNVEAHFSQARRWESSGPVKVLPQKFLIDEALHLSCCGDWCGMAQAEGAYLSALSLAYQLKTLVSA